jgi:transposase InsO family protein
MLTDNGQQYTNWRGKTCFEHEMKKNRVKHIRSRPHNPMTLGKIERFWKTILGEFLQGAQFGSYEEAVERCARCRKG